jgi:hypothetical protein
MTPIAGRFQFSTNGKMRDSKSRSLPADLEYYEPSIAWLAKQ